MFVSGARSWCETSDTNSVFRRSSWRSSALAWASSAFVPASCEVASSRWLVRSATMDSRSTLTSASAADAPA